MTDARNIHAAEFALHLPVWSAEPFWQYRFGRAVPAGLRKDLKDELTSGAPLTADALYQLIETTLGASAITWLESVFISTADPRPQRQENFFAQTVLPILAPERDAEGIAANALAARMTKERTQALEAFETCSQTYAAALDMLEDDADYCRATEGFLWATDPARRLFQSEAAWLFAPDWRAQL